MVWHDMVWAYLSVLMGSTHRRFFQRSGMKFRRRSGIESGINGGQHLNNNNINLGRPNVKQQVRMEFSKQHHGSSALSGGRTVDVRRLF